MKLGTRASASAGGSGSVLHFIEALGHEEQSNVVRAAVGRDQDVAAQCGHQHLWCVCERVSMKRRSGSEREGERERGREGKCERASVRDKKEREECMRGQHTPLSDHTRHQTSPAGEMRALASEPAALRSAAVASVDIVPALRKQAFRVGGLGVKVGDFF